MRTTLSHLVQNGSRTWGRLASRPQRVNPLDEFRGLRRHARTLRLKNWAGFTLLHPHVSSSMILQDAHYLASSEIYVRDEVGLVEHARNARGGSMPLSEELFGTSSRFVRPGYRIGYRWCADPAGFHRIEADVAATDRQAAIKVDLALDGSRASVPLSVSSPLPGGSMYTHKAVFAASGTISVGDRTYTFEPGRDLAILDEHASLLPYRTTWTWGTFAQRTPTGIVGANLAARPMVPGTAEESCLWLPGRIEDLADIDFVPSTDDPRDPWRMRSADGRVDVTFQPEDRKSVKHQMGLFAIDYWQMVGTYSGAVGGHEVEAARGVLESMRARL